MVDGVEKLSKHTEKHLPDCDTSVSYVEAVSGYLKDSIGRPKSLGIIQKSSFFEKGEPNYDGCYGRSKRPCPDTDYTCVPWDGGVANQDPCPPIKNNDDLKNETLLVTDKVGHKNDWRMFYPQQGLPINYNHGGAGAGETVATIDGNGHVTFKDSRLAAARIIRPKSDSAETLTAHTLSQQPVKPMNLTMYEAVLPVYARDTGFKPGKNETICDKGIY